MNGVGHSLGGALASIAALSVKSNFPSASVLLFTYGVLSK
jgi:predicted lipase